jgi:ribonuclease Y
MAFWLPLIAGLVAGGAAFALGLQRERKAARRLQESASRTVAETHAEAQGKAKEILVAAQEKALALEEEVDRRERDFEAREAAVEAKARRAEREAADLARRMRDLERKQANVARAEEAAEKAEAETREQLERARAQLERIAGLTVEEARAELTARIEEEARREGAQITRRIEDEAREGAHREARNLVVQAAEALDLKEVMESTVTFVRLPNDEMKGRIIGREGRNIRAIETATGIDLVVDDTPRAILVSCFDPLRREVAKQSIERLVEDGRIHPARIEEVVAKVREDVDTMVEEAGSQAAFGLGIPDLHRRLCKLVGRMRFRTHHGQNPLAHATEVARSSPPTWPTSWAPRRRWCAAPACCTRWVAWTRPPPGTPSWWRPSWSGGTGNPRRWCTPSRACTRRWRPRASRPSWWPPPTASPITARARGRRTWRSSSSACGAWR